MSDIVIPPELPPPLQNGFRRKLDKSSVRTDFEVGIGRKRRTIRAAPKLVDVTWDIPFAQYQLFDDWFVDDLLNGEKTFDVYIEGLWYEANFISSPAYKATFDHELNRVIIDAQLVLGVGANSGIANRNNSVDLGATLTATLYAQAVGAFTVALGATLTATLRGTATPNVIQPFSATLTASMDMQVDNGPALAATLTATLLGSVAPVSGTRESDTSVTRETDSGATRDLDITV